MTLREEGRTMDPLRVKGEFWRNPQWRSHFYNDLEVWGELVSLTEGDDVGRRGNRSDLPTGLISYNLKKGIN